MPKENALVYTAQENSISPTSLAYWLMDDGGLLSYNKDYPRRGLVLNTHGFSLEECEILSENLNRAYNLHSWCKKNKGKHIIALPANKWPEICTMISPDVIESMRYKFPRWTPVTV